MRIMKNNENNGSNVSPKVSSSSNIPVAMSPRGWKVSSAILLGPARPAPCAKRCIRCSSWLYESVLSKIPLQLLHLTAKDCCPPSHWTLLVLIFSWLQEHRQNDQISTGGVHILCINSENFESFGFMLQISLHHIQLLSWSSARTSR